MSIINKSKKASEMMMGRESVTNKLSKLKQSNFIN